MTLLDEADHVAGLGVEVAPADLRPVLDLLHRDVARLPAGFLGLLTLFVLELAVVHDPAHGRVRVGGHLHQVEVEASGHPQSLGHGLDAELVTGGSDEADLPGPDPVVDPVLVSALFLSRCYG